MRHVPHAVGYRAPCRCNTCTPLTSHSAGGSAPSSIPNAPRGTLYQGDKLPQERKRLNGRSLGIVCLDVESGSESYAGATSCAAPVWRGWEGAVTMMAGSAPVGVPPGYPTLSWHSESECQGKGMREQGKAYLVGYNSGKLLVGDGGG